MPTAAILTIGNELTSGDVADTNGAWLAHRLERIGVEAELAPLGGVVEPRPGKAEAFREARERQRRLYEVVTSEPTS